MSPDRPSGVAAVAPPPSAPRSVQAAVALAPGGNGGAAARRWRLGAGDPPEVEERLLVEPVRRRCFQDASASPIPTGPAPWDLKDRKLA